MFMGTMIECFSKQISSLQLTFVSTFMDFPMMLVEAFSLMTAALRLVPEATGTAKNDWETN